MTIALYPHGSNLAPFAAIHARCFADAWNEKALGDLLATPGTFLLSDGQSFILTRVAGPEAEILTLAVAPEARRCGTGGTLVEAAAAHAYAAGARDMFLEVAASNLPARTLYRRLGFVEAGRRKAYYPAGHEFPEDALVLRRPLPLAPLGKSKTTG